MREKKKKKNFFLLGVRGMQTLLRRLLDFILLLVVGARSLVAMEHGRGEDRDTGQDVGVSVL
jgi:hypothetical protein